MTKGTNDLRLEHSHARALLVGSALSLWRTVFFPPATAPTDEETLDGARLVLRYLVRDNRFEFVQDKSAQAWRFRYYVNNACFRLIDAKRLIDPDSRTRELAERTAEGRIQWVHGATPMQTWETTFGVHLRIWGLLQDQTEVTR